jgi:leucyl/phenylalanyl-tRNA--protein transferase
MRDPGKGCTPSGMIFCVTVFMLNEEMRFPHPELADASGLLAVGGDLQPERLLLGYQSGIFPWYEEGLPILWHSPDPRMILRPSELAVSRSLKKTLRRGRFLIRLDSAFEQVMRQCARVPRPGQHGTWITEDMIEAYINLHRLGYAHSAEAFLDGELVGGLYGVSLGNTFFGESMFAHVSDASKVAFVMLVQQLQAWGFSLVDCQVHTVHLSRFGASLWPRDEFLLALAESMQSPTRRGEWTFDKTNKVT